MKNLLLFLSLFFVADLAFGQGDAPPFVQGQAQATKSVATVIQVPNNLATKTSASKTLIETGNKNILQNPSFEATPNPNHPGWVQTGIVSPNVETTVVIDGKQSVKLTSPNQTLDFHADSTLYASQFADGVQGLAMIRAKTTTTDTPIYVCPRTAGAYPTTKTSGCVQIQPTGKWGLYKVPFLLGGTSNGIGITSNSVATTGDVYIDDAFVGAVDLKQDVTTAKFFASKKFVTGASGCDFTTTSTSYVTPAAVAGCNTPTNAGNTTDTTKDPHIRLNSYPTGRYYIVARGSLYNSSANTQLLLRMTDGTKFSSQLSVFSSTAPISEGVLIGEWENTTPQASATISVQIAVIGTTTAGIYTGGIASDYEISVYYFPTVAASTYSSQCGANCVDTFSATTSSGAVLAGSENVDWLNGNPTISTNSFTYTFNTGIFTAAPNCTCTSGPFGAGTSDFTCSISSVSSTQLVVQTSQQGAGAATAHTLNCQKQSADFVATRTIQGSFKEIPTTQGSSGADLQSVYFGTGATCGTQCSTGTCTICNQVGNKITSVTWVSTGTYRLNGIDGTKYNCTGTGVGASWFPLYHDRNVSTSTYAQMAAGTSAASNSAYNSIVCIGIP
jgi:hypothetical protein